MNNCREVFPKKVHIQTKFLFVALLVIQFLLSNPSGIRILILQDNSLRKRRRNGDASLFIERNNLLAHLGNV